MSRPPWEMEVVEGLDNVPGLPQGSYAIATKVHHSALDGAAFMRFIASMADKDNKGTPVLPLETTTGEMGEMPSLVTMMNRAAINNARSPIRFFGALLRATPGLYRLAQDALKTSAHEEMTVPVTRFDQPVSSQKVFDGIHFELDDLKAIRKAAAGATINDVVLAICGGALRRYLEHHDDLPEESLVAWVPVNARTGSETDEQTGGNNISAMTVPVFTDIGDPMARLSSLRQATALKKSNAGGAAKLITDISRHIAAVPQVFTSQLMVRSGMVASRCNLFVSNVPGPAETLYMNGARAAMTFGMAPLSDGLGLFIATPSFAGKIGFLVTSTKEILPDIRFFVECLEGSMNELKKATAKQRGRTAAKGKG